MKTAKNTKTLSLGRVQGHRVSEILCRLLNNMYPKYSAGRTPVSYEDTVATYLIVVDGKSFPKKTVEEMKFFVLTVLRTLGCLDFSPFVPNQDGEWGVVH